MRPNPIGYFSTSIADASRMYVRGLQYQGNGGSLSSMSCGNGTTQTFGLNDRFQMTNQTLLKGSEVLQKYDYTFGELDAGGVLKNNGKLESIVSHVGAAKQWTQKFSYDSIGRLKQSEERRGDTNVLTYKQVFDFDRFGNMYRKASSNPTAGQEHPLAYTAIEDADVSKSTNRLTSNTTYDDAGNVTTDNKFRSMGFGYDANGRMVKATKANTPDALSVYDASGLRVAEKVNDVWRFLIYDIDGKLVSEYGGIQSTDEGGVKYLLSDWQGSMRAVVSNSGFVVGRNDYTAFGEDIQGGVGLRTIQQGFGSSVNVRQKYGLSERDDSTGTDHTWFRKHENRAGRWTSPDPYDGSMEIGDPQSFNRFGYVGGDPTNFIDPSGLDGLSDAIAGAAEFLKRNKACSDLFTKKGIKDPLAFLKSAKIKESKNEPKFYTDKGITFGKKGWEPDKNGVVNAALTVAYGPGKGIYVNPAAIANNSPSQGLSGPAALSGPHFAILTILHELAHLAKVIPGDATSPTQSNANSQKIWEECFLKDPIWRYTIPLRAGGGGRGDHSGGGGGGSRYDNSRQFDWLEWYYRRTYTSVRMLP